MISPPGLGGAAFTTADEGNVRADPEARARVAERLGIPADWATVRQVHGVEVVEADRPGLLGEADALFSSVPGLPVSVAVADCVPVVLESHRAVGVAHAGWRGLAAGTVGSLREAMEAAGHPPARAAVGPAIGPCCYEVGQDVAERFPGHLAETSWGTTSVDLWGAAEEALAGLPVWSARRCTRCDGRFYSYRRDRTGGRQVAVAWVPGDGSRPG